MNLSASCHMFSGYGRLHDVVHAILILFGAWLLPGLKLSECQLQKSVVWLSGCSRVRLPNTIVWTLLGSHLALYSTSGF